MWTLDSRDAFFLKKDGVQEAVERESSLLSSLSLNKDVPFAKVLGGLSIASSGNRLKIFGGMSINTL